MNALVLGTILTTGCQPASLDVGPDGIQAPTEGVEAAPVRRGDMASQVLLSARRQGDVDSRRNVLIVLVDDLGVDKVGAYAADVDPDYAETAEVLPHTPVLDTLAAAGVRFTDAWANAACSPTRASLLTGQVPSRHGVGDPVGREGNPPLDLDVHTYAQLALAADYRTGLFGKWHLGDLTPAHWAEGETWEDHLDEIVAEEFPANTLGFEAFAGTVADLDIDGREGYYDWLRITASRVGGAVTRPTVSSVYATEQTTQDALQWIARQRSAWVATVTFHAPHAPYQQPPQGCGTVALDPDERYPSPVIHQAMVECLDQWVGELLDGIGELDRTTVVLLGDNGTSSGVAEGIFDDGRGKGSLYESGVRVPFVVADGADYLAALGVAEHPPQDEGLVHRPGRQSHALVHARDVYATLSHWLGGEVLAGEDSVSLAPLLDDTAEAVRDLVTSERFNDTAGAMSLRRGDDKLIVWGQRDPDTGLACRKRSELYDLSADRLEYHDLREEAPETYLDLLEELERVLEDHGEDRWLTLDACG